MNEERRDELLLQMSKNLAEIKVKLDADYKALHGDGQPGLVSQVASLDKRISNVEMEISSSQKHSGTFWIVVGFIINALIALYGVLKNAGIK